MAQINNLSRRSLLGMGVAVACLPASQAIAHALPGTKITLTPGKTALGAVVEIPLHELALAFPQGQLDGITALSAQQKDMLFTYLRAHISFTPRGGSALPIITAEMALHDATHENIGNYQVLVVRLSLAVPAQTAVFPLQLRYDGVIHKVRNHDADVFLTLLSGEKRPVGEIAYSYTSKDVPPLEIEAP